MNELIHRTESEIAHVCIIQAINRSVSSTGSLAHSAHVTVYIIMVGRCIFTSTYIITQTDWHIVSK